MSTHDVNQIIKDINDSQNDGQVISADIFKKRRGISSKLWNRLSELNNKKEFKEGQIEDKTGFGIVDAQLKDFYNRNDKHLKKVA